MRVNRGFELYPLLQLCLYLFSIIFFLQVDTSSRLSEKLMLRRDEKPLQTIFYFLGKPIAFPFNFIYPVKGSRLFYKGWFKRG